MSDERKREEIGSRLDTIIPWPSSYSSFSSLPLTLNLNLTLTHTPALPVARTRFARGRRGKHPRSPQQQVLQAEAAPGGGGATTLHHGRAASSEVKRIAGSGGWMLLGLRLETWLGSEAFAGAGAGARSLNKVLGCGPPARGSVMETRTRTRTRTRIRTRARARDAP